MKLAHINLSSNLSLLVVSFFVLIILMPSGLAQDKKQAKKKPLHRSMFLKEKTRFDNRKAFTKEKNIIHLMELIKEAGMTQDDLAKWDLASTKDRQKLLQYLEKLQASKIEEQRRIKLFLSKKFRTVMDIWKNLQQNEDDALVKMSEKLIDESS